MFLCYCAALVAYSINNNVILQTNEPILMPLGTSGQRAKDVHEAINFGGKEVKGQGHIKPNIDLEAWRRHYSRPPLARPFTEYNQTHQCYVLRIIILPSLCTVCSEQHYSVVTFVSKVQRTPSKNT